MAIDEKVEKDNVEVGEKAPQWMLSGRHIVMITVPVSGRRTGGSTYIARSLSEGKYSKPKNIDPERIFRVTGINGRGYVAIRVGDEEARRVIDWTSGKREEKPRVGETTEEKPEECISITYEELKEKYTSVRVAGRSYFKQGNQVFHIYNPSRGRQSTYYLIKSDEDMSVRVLRVLENRETGKKKSGKTK